MWERSQVFCQFFNIVSIYKWLQIINLLNLKVKKLCSAVEAGYLKWSSSKRFLLTC